MRVSQLPTQFNIVTVSAPRGQPPDVQKMSCLNVFRPTFYFASLTYCLLLASLFLGPDGV